MIKIENLKKVFNHNVIALENFNLEIEDKQFIALLGPSGCGKSTTLNCIAGLLNPTEGKISFDGNDVTDKAPKERNIGMVFQSYALYPHMSVIDNIAFPLKQKKMGKEERHDKARKVAKMLQIEHLLNRKPSELSGGQQQRVAMCRAIVKEPDILLLDEPMSNLDARLKIEIREVIKQLQQDLNVTCILVTHDQEEAMALADKIAILDDGKIQQYDTPSMLYKFPSNLFVANFMGNPPMNFIDAKVISQEDGTIFDILDQKISMPIKLTRDVKGKKVKIGIRSHSIGVKLKNETDEDIKMAVRIIENLGKELLIYGYLGNDEIRVTTTDTDMYEEIKKNKTVYLSLGNDINVFDNTDGNNITR